jgi:DNA-binding transcriptional LysR family regulator
MFELSQLRCFAAVAEELHFGRAAARLNMTQPPLDRQIQLLEHALGVGLFERTSRSVRLTPAGRAFHAEARRVLDLAEGAGLAAKRVARGEAGSITIGFTAAASYGFLPRLLAAARAAMPGVDLALKKMVTADQTEALSSGQIDLGLLRPPVDRKRRVETLLRAA